LLFTFQVLGRLLRENRENQNKRNLEDVSMLVMYIWVLCNVYTIRPRHIINKVERLWDNYKDLKKYSKHKKTATFLGKLQSFKNELPKLFDIKCVDKKRISKQAVVWGVRMEHEDDLFYQNQAKTPPIGYCTGIIDKHALAKSIREKQRIQNVQDQKLERDKYLEDLKGISFDEEYLNELLNDEISRSEGSAVSDNDNFDPEEGQSKAKKRYEYAPSLDIQDDMPYKYRHVREGMRRVKPEFYKVAHCLAATYHMSRNQIEGALCTVANTLFGRNWKPFKPNTPLDDDSLPAMTNLVRTRDYMEALALNAIVEEIMSNENSSITYSNDGSALNKVGKYIVQSITINGVQRALPSLSVVTETHENLKNLEITTLQILSAATGYKYSEQDILSRINFVMTDSTAHNIGVIEKVCHELEVSVVPKTLLCNIHPLMLFQSKLKEFFDDIQQSFGARKLDDCFTVDIDFKDENFVLKSIKCLTNFINKENSAKPWNRYCHFTQFIAPKKNESVELKDHRFNRINDCCLALLYHIDDIAHYLQKFENITNSMAILDRNFVEMTDILKPLYAATALLGVHVLRPFYQLLIDLDTTYTSLLTVFPKLYEELSTMEPDELFSKQQVFTFANAKMFEKSLPKPYLLDNLMEVCAEFHDDVCKILRICLTKFAKGFEKQKGAIFGFGITASNDTGHVLKICEVGDTTQLQNVPIHNLGEERSVGLLNYEIGVRGQHNFNSASQSIVQNKASDLIHKSYTQMRWYRKQASEIKKMKLQWNEKMRKLEKEGLNKQEAMVLSLEQKKLKDLDYLKKQSIPGPFATVEDVDTFMDSAAEPYRNERLYIEVRYLKHSTTTIKRTSSLFKLKKCGKNLASEDYSHNLKLYFGCVNSSTTTLSLADLSMVLTGLNAAVGSNERVQTSSITQTSKNEEQQIKAGTHCAAVWMDDDTSQLNWFIGIIMYFLKLSVQYYQYY